MVRASESETVGMVTIESLAAETPVLGSDTGGTPEIMNNSEGGLLFESMNSDDLAAKIDEIVSTPPPYEPQKLKKLIAPFDHHSVCEKVEAVLGITPSH